MIFIFTWKNCKMSFTFTFPLKCYVCLEKYLVIPVRRRPPMLCVSNLTLWWIDTFSQLGTRSRPNRVGSIPRGKQRLNTPKTYIVRNIARSSIRYYKYIIMWPYTATTVERPYKNRRRYNCDCAVVLNATRPVLIN